MKILFITKGDLPDYQADTIMHGGRSVLGSDFVDANFTWYMYKKDKEQYWNQRVPHGGNSYGRGMTLHGSLPDCEVDRTNIEEKIRMKEFDYIIYGSSTRWLQYIELVLTHYPKDRVVFVDGEDDQNLRDNLLEHGILFKRELNHHKSGVHPISFGAPKEKIVANVPEKTQDWATVIPGRMETYIFNDEASYYADYQKSYFALTHKKGGWDCMRHYEILLNGCVPHFPGITECPKLTMTDFPKDLLHKISHVLTQSNPELNLEWYNEISNELLNYTKEKLTTEAVFNKMLKVLHE